MAQYKRRGDRAMNRKQMQFAVMLSGVLCAAAGFARANQESVASGAPDAPRRPFLLQVNSEESTRVGDWNGDFSMRAYAKAHPGTYVLFLAEGTLYRLDKPDNLAEAQRLYAPIRALGQEQGVLGRQQSALGQEQGNLGRQMSAARYDPAAMQALGEQQGNLGRMQGTLGAQQGNLGRQQAELSRALYKRVEEMIDACLRDRSCAAISPQAAG
jgi:hypothetical protein